MGLFDKSSKYWANPNRLTSFKVVKEGIRVMWKEEINFRIHLLISGTVIFLGFVVGVDLEEWKWLLLLIGLVITLEVVNTALETLVDLCVGEKWHPLAKRAKDLSALAVFIMAIMSVIIGGMIFLPRLLELIR